MYSVSHGKMKTTEPGTDLKAEGPLGVASLLVGAWAVPQRPNAWVFDSTCGKTLDELNKLVLSLPATIAPKPIARPRLDSDVEAVGQFLKSSFSGQSRASDWCWLKGCGETLTASLISSLRVSPRVVSQSQQLGHCGAAQAATSRLATKPPSSLSNFLLASFVHIFCTQKPCWVLPSQNRPPPHSLYLLPFRFY